jgi:hypothetical protein
MHTYAIALLFIYLFRNWLLLCCVCLKSSSGNKFVAKIPACRSQKNKSSFCANNMQVANELTFHLTLLHAEVKPKLKRERGRSIERKNSELKFKNLFNERFMVIRVVHKFVTLTA